MVITAVVARHHQCARVAQAEAPIGIFAIVTVTSAIVQTIISSSNSSSDTLAVLDRVAVVRPVTGTVVVEVAIRSVTPAPTTLISGAAPMNHRNGSSDSRWARPHRTGTMIVNATIERLVATVRQQGGVATASSHRSRIGSEAIRERVAELGKLPKAPLSRLAVVVP